MNHGYTHIYAPDLDREDTTRPLLDDQAGGQPAADQWGLAGAGHRRGGAETEQPGQRDAWCRKTGSLWDWLQHGITVKYASGGEERSGIVRLVDYENAGQNEFLVVNQFSFTENGVTRRPDVLLYVNGLPLVLMELKSPSQVEVGVENAYRQIRNYMQDIPSLFYYNAHLRHQRPFQQPCGHHHGGAGPLHGVEAQGPGRDRDGRRQPV